jgi:hypothetical protein
LAAKSFQFSVFEKWLILDNFFGSFLNLANSKNALFSIRATAAGREILHFIESILL